MSLEWAWAEEAIRLSGTDQPRILLGDAARQTHTAIEILEGFRDRPGVLLSDEVGMGKTYVALAVAASVILSTKGSRGPVVVMVPSSLRRKWQREWQQFRLHCAIGGKLDWIRDTYAHAPTDFFKLLDDDRHQRYHLVFLTTGCFSQGIRDGWIKLAMVRLARETTRLSSQQKRRIYRWATHLIRFTSRRHLTEDVIERLLNSNVANWKTILVREALLDEDADDPVPELLSSVKHKIDWSGLVSFIRDRLPDRVSDNIDTRLKHARADFSAECQGIYQQWLELSQWRSPLLILDEAHHAKNDTTRLAKLFRQASSDEVSLLQGKFQRMLFLTATPFQLGHQELIRVVRSFDAVRWTGAEAPSLEREDLQQEIDHLAQSLDANRLAAQRLDRLWGEVRLETLEGQSVNDWWERVQRAPRDSYERRLLEYIEECRATRAGAEQLLRPWVIRHNRAPTVSVNDMPQVSLRRQGVFGRAILSDAAENDDGEQGLPIDRSSALPFLLTARAQGELSRMSGARAFFAEGLSSSYEAFHHTRTARDKARDVGDDGRIIDTSVPPETKVKTIVPTSWYEEQVSRIIPSRDASRQARMSHPKIAATVERVVDLWRGGEKVLVFCFYRETCRALFEHIRDEIHDCTLRIAGEKLGGEYATDSALTHAFLTRIARRCSEVGRPFYNEVRQVLSQPFEQPRYQVFTEPQRRRLVEVMAAYFRAPSFLARYLPLDDPRVQRAWELGEGRRDVLEPGIVALRHGIEERTDQSNQTFLSRVKQFLDFAIELAERSRYARDEDEESCEDEPIDPLDECLHAVSVYSKPRQSEDEDDQDPLDVNTNDAASDDEGSYRAAALVRVVHGATKLDTRERLAQAFNSPLFPEVLVSSGVMGEGIDLHRFCRHVIHHDGYWNPSTLEQQTGRLDRIRCKAELCRMPIRVYQPFIAGGADEKMFRVVRDRERWFQIVMGQKFEFDERSSEAVAARVPLPDELAKELTFDLARWRTERDET